MLTPVSDVYGNAKVYPSDMNIFPLFVVMEALEIGITPHISSVPSACFRYLPLLLLFVSTIELLSMISLSALP